MRIAGCIMATISIRFRVFIPNRRTCIYKQYQSPKILLLFLNIFIIPKEIRIEL
jgi:hypothetical protein